MKWEGIKWTSFRQSYPLECGLYYVRNVNEDLNGTAYYNGFDFENVEWDLKLKGSLMLPSLELTHWNSGGVNEIIR
ncbi:MAG: hypothetical protein KAS32_29085 [Candidatus Peribacteraceae bacterium]|nr:hypothetical protein [Candidatus Peribacteraceae bacterium]